MKKIYIDAGHNPHSYNTGAVGNGMKEQDITYEVCKYLEKILKDDFEIKLSRPTESTMLGTNNSTAINARWQQSNDWGADYFISVHVNAGGGTGAETFYFHDNALNFAKTLQDTYSEEMNLRNRRTEKRDNLAVIRHTNHPSILLELAFIDSPLTNPDVEILQNKRKEMAQAIAKGLYKYFNITPNIKEEEEMRYNNIEEIPNWGQETIKKLIDKNLLSGDGNNLNLSEDMIRIFVINDRAGVYN